MQLSYTRRKKRKTNPQGRKNVAVRPGQETERERERDREGDR